MPDSTRRGKGFREYKYDFYCPKSPGKMADLPQRRGPGRPPKPKKTPPIVFQLPEGDYEYLTYVARVLHRLGDSENDVARSIVIREIEKMMRGRYHKRGTPTDGDAKA
jgi:hypothetical protein